MDRRRALSLGTTLLVGLAGCSTGSGPGTDGTPRSPGSPSTTTRPGRTPIRSEGSPDTSARPTWASERIDGSVRYYRLRNTGDSEATIRIETVLSIEGGGTYSSFAVVTVPAGDEVTVRYRIVRFDDLSDAERTKVRRGGGIDFDVYVNGERRDDA